MQTLPQNADSAMTGEEFCLRVQEALHDLGFLDSSRQVELATASFASQSVGFKVRFATALCDALRKAGFLAADLNYSHLLYPADADVKRISEFLDNKLAIHDHNATNHGVLIDGQNGSEPSIGLIEGELVAELTWSRLGDILQKWVSSSSEAGTEDSQARRLRMARNYRKARISPPVQSDTETGSIAILRSDEQSKVKPSNAEGSIEPELVTQWKALEAEYRSSAARLGRLVSVSRAREIENAILQDRVKAREKARLLATADADGNFAKLQAIVAASQKRLLELVEEWERHRVPLVDELELQTEARAVKLNEESELFGDITAAQDELRDIQDRLQDASLYVSANGEEKKVVYVPGKGAELRASVVARVLDSVKQLKKQSREIEKAVEDVKLVQRDVSAASETMVLIESELDEIIFTTAKIHPVGVEAYEFFVELTEKFDELMEMEHNSHLAEIDARDKTARCHSVAARVSTQKLNSVLSDLEKLRAENRNLMDLGQRG